MKTKLISAAVVLLLASSGAFADTFKILGPRALGMGGAYVAVAQDALAQHWNPAGLAQQKGFDVQMPIGGRVEFTGGVLKNANQLADLATKFDKIQAAQTSGNPGDFDAEAMGAFFEGLKEIGELNNPGKGVLAEVNGGANFRMGRFALSVNNFTSVGANPNVDLVNIGLGGATGIAGVDFTGADESTPGNATQLQAANLFEAAINAVGFANLDALTGGAISAGLATDDAINLSEALVNAAVANGVSNADILAAAQAAQAAAGEAAPIIAAGASGNPYTNNTSNLTLRGASFTEIALGYGMPVPFLPLKGLYVGGNLKLIRGDVGFFQQNVLNDATKSGDVLGDFNKNAKTSWQPAVDLGVLWDLGEYEIPLKPRFGLVAKNINNPKFGAPQAAVDAGQGGDTALNPQLRFGGAIRPFKFWIVSMDMDLTNNLTFIPGFQSRQFALGTEINVFNRSWLNIPLRAGLNKNLSEDSALTYTAGFGLNLMHFTLDFGGAVSSETEDIHTDGTKTTIPANIAIAAQLALNF